MNVGPQQPTPPGGSRPHRASIKVVEDATWVGSRGKTHSYGFASFDVEPDTANGRTQMHVRNWDTAPSTTGELTLFDKFMLQCPVRWQWHNHVRMRSVGLSLRMITDWIIGRQRSWE